MSLHAMLKSLLLAVLLALPGVSAVVAEESTAAKHLGVATCASGVCHGSVEPRTATRVMQNEYVVWSLRDRHRSAYQTLLRPESVAIAEKLGLENAHEAGICLDCHADNVALKQRGARFQIDDGVGCEACHGGSEDYIATHVDPQLSRAAKLDDGLLPLDDPRQRASLCLSCHLGTADKMATHEIMGAGHPRLSFELETFGLLQPMHYAIDDDYRDSKWAGSSVELWAIGQVQNSRQTLLLLRDRLQTSGLFPELALFDCHACHHPMSDQRWQPSERTRLPPGAVRLNDANFAMLSILAGLMDTQLQAGIAAAIRDLHTAAVSGASLQPAIDGLLALVEQVDTGLAELPLQRRTVELMDAIAAQALSGKLNDYVAAEQAVMAIDLMLHATGERDAYAGWLDAVYQSVANENEFVSADFIKQMRGFQKRG
jgi:hypothetical protein